MKRWVWAVAAVVAVAGGILAWQFLKRVPPGEVVELIGEEGSRVLREPMREPAAGPRVLVLALDGVGEDELRAAIESGRAPNLAALFGASAGDGVFEHGFIARDALSILPSTTLPAWASLFTGRPAGETGISGNEFFVREERRFYAPAPVSVTGTGDAIRSYSDGLMGSVLRVPTVYEMADVRSYVALSHIHRGADLLVIPDLSSMAEIVVAMVAGVGGDEEEPETEEYAELDDEAVEITIEEMGERGIPALNVVYFPGIDLYTHIAPDPLPQQREYITDVIDAAAGRLLNAYRDAGVLDSTWVMIVSDHGHTPVLDDDRHSLGTGDDDEPTSLIEESGYRLRPLELEEDSAGDYQAVVAYQGAFGYVYVADRSTCVQEGQPCDWNRAPRLEQDVLPLVRAFDAANRTGAVVPELRGTLDMILAREPRPPGTDALPFQVWDGSALVDMGTYLERNPRPDLLEFEQRMRGLAAGPYGHRAGDILLFAKSGDARPMEERFYFSSGYRSWHGSPAPQDSRIALAVAHGGSAGPALRQRFGGKPGILDQLDITRIILELLERSPR